MGENLASAGTSPVLALLWKGAGTRGECHQALGILVFLPHADLAVCQAFADLR
jgi:hypothetical protein